MLWAMGVSGGLSGWWWFAGRGIMFRGTVVFFKVGSHALNSTSGDRGTDYHGADYHIPEEADVPCGAG